ncbi:hypothetical protein FKP32DRAFT_1142485 [Trametes sanguinea]|nr:hypothetical protein FKP32DRAFT_1142485 [Trametes sanguinea]
MLEATVEGRDAPTSARRGRGGMSISGALTIRRERIKLFMRPGGGAGDNPRPLVHLSPGSQLSFRGLFFAPVNEGDGKPRGGDAHLVHCRMRAGLRGMRRTVHSPRRTERVVVCRIVYRATVQVAGGCVRRRRWERLTKRRSDGRERSGVVDARNGKRAGTRWIRLGGDLSLSSARSVTLNGFFPPNARWADATVLSAPLAKRDAPGLLIHGPAPRSIYYTPPRHLRPHSPSEFAHSPLLSSSSAAACASAS